MNAFYVTVQGQEYFQIATSKKAAMIKVIELHRVITGFQGELSATARVDRGYNAEQNCMVNV